MAPAAFFLAISLLSFSTLILEISLTRLFSVAQGYHFAFFVVSIALLGTGASGSFLFLFPQILRKDGGKNLSWFCWLFSFSTLLAYMLSNLLPFDLARIYLDRWQIFYIFIYYLLFSLPFFFSGLTISSALALRSLISGKIYFADLLGAGLGCLLALLLFNLWEGPGTLVFSAFSAFWASLIFAWPRREKLAMSLIKCSWGFILFVFLFWPPSFLDLRLSPYKPLKTALLYPGARLLETYWNLFGRIDILISPAIRTAPGLSLLFEDPLPFQIGLAIDGERLSAITKIKSVEADRKNLQFITALPSSFPYELLKPEKVLIFEPLGGLEILIALYHEARKIVVVEINPLLVALLQGKYREISGGIYNNPRVSVAIDDIRNFGRRNAQPFDLIVFPLTESWALTSSGLSSLHEDYRLTTEAIMDYLQLLSPHGALAMSLYLNLPPRAELRLISMIKEALLRMGKDPWQHLLIFRTWATFHLLVKKNPLQVKEAQMLASFCQRWHFDLVYFPGITAEKTNIYNRFPTPIYFQGVQKVLSGDQNFYHNYPFDLTPATDEKPFFHHYFRWSHLGQLYQITGQKWQIFIEGGYLVPLLLLIALILTLIFIALPLLYRMSKKQISINDQKYKGACLIYFTALGLGFMMVEISLIQRFILFLGHPVYSVALVICSMLIWAGLGSRFSPRLLANGTWIIKLIFALIIIILLFYALALTSILALFQSLPLLGRQIFTALLTGLLAFFMGMPFPLGIRMLGNKAPDLIPLGWCANGCASVIGAILPMIIALAGGFQMVFYISAFLYGLSFIAWRKFS